MLLSVISLTVDAQVSPPSGLQEALRARIEAVREAPAARVVRGSRLLQARAVAAFFEGRAFKPAWTGPQDPEAVLAAIRRLDEDGLTPADYHLAAIESLLAARSKAASAEAEADLQVLLTDAVAALVDHVRYGKVQPVTLDPRWNVDPRVGTPALETTLAELEAAAAPAGAIDSLKPNHFIYAGLKKELGRLREVAKAGGWAIVPAGPALKPGARDPRVILIRKRLAATGELPSSAPLDNDAYDKDVATAVKLFQERNRFTADGTIGKITLDALNVSVASRIDQVRINLERARWVVGGLSDSFVLVNLPAFKVYFIRDRKNVWETRAQIGKQARATPAFRADIRYLVLNPDWTVPPGILEDVLAGMRKGQNPIARKNLSYPGSPGKPGRSCLDRLGQSLDEELRLYAAAAARSRKRARTRQVHLPERALRVPARHAEQRAVLRRSAHVQLGMHPRREPARSRLGAARARRLDPRTRAGGHRCRRFPDRPAENAASGTDRLLDGQRRRRRRPAFRPGRVQPRRQRAAGPRRRHGRSGARGHGAPRMPDFARARMPCSRLENPDVTGGAAISRNWSCRMASSPQTRAIAARSSTSWRTASGSD